MARKYPLLFFAIGLHLSGPLILTSYRSVGHFPNSHIYLCILPEFIMVTESCLRQMMYCFVQPLMPKLQASSEAPWAVVTLTSRHSSSRDQLLAWATYWRVAVM